MAVRNIRFSDPVNASERMAEDKCRSVLEKISDSATWCVLAGLASSSSPLQQSDDLDLVLIGPRGVFLVEVKHWDALWVNANTNIVALEAEKLTAKARRLAGRIQHAIQDRPKVIQVFLLTREPIGQNLPPAIRGVPVWTLRDLSKILRELPTGIMNELQIQKLVGTLEPAAKVHLEGGIRRIASYQNLELQKPNESIAHRVYRGLHHRTKERVLLHLYDLSATTEKNPERQADRESRALQMLQRSQFVPRVRDTLRELAEYPGELYYFTVLDPDAPSLASRSADASWLGTERIDFSANCCKALLEIHGMTDHDSIKIVHRNLSPQSILVGPNNQPIFVNFCLSRLPNTLTLGNSHPVTSNFNAPEIRQNGIGYATQFSDVFSLCSTLMTLFSELGDGDCTAAKKALLSGCVDNPESRVALSTIEGSLRKCLAPSPVDLPQYAPPPPEKIPPADYWSEGQLLPFRDMTLRILNHLGSGGVGRTFKVEQIDPKNGENFGTFVAKVMKAQDSGRAALQSYQRVRSHTTTMGLSVVFETAAEWHENQIVALLKWIEGESLDGLSGLLPIVAEEAGDESVENLLQRWFEDVCRSLGKLHTKNLVHGDVSPRNLIYDHGGLTLTDYDLVTSIGRQAWGIGAIAYCSPEAQRREPMEPSDDIFALTASLFEVAFNHPAFSSPHGAISKSDGLDWRVGERESLPKLAAIFDQTTHSDRTRRFSSVENVISALEHLGNEQHIATDTLIPEIVQRSAQQVEWLDSLLRIYPGSPHGNIETRGLDTDFALATYVETPLEQSLFESLSNRTVRLVLLCGNAGDGKTALLQHLATKFGIARHQSAQRIWQAKTEDGLLLRANLDGSASWLGRSANELLDEFLQPFLNGVPQNDIAHLLAINDGRLYEWLENLERATGRSPLSIALRSFLSHNDETYQAPDHVQFISLNHRSLVGGRTPGGEWSDDFIDRLIQRLLGGDKAAQIWEPCLKCSAWDRCVAGPNAHRLLAYSGTPQANLGKQLCSRIKESLQAVHQRGQVHITTRELRGVLSYVLFGINSCEELHNEPGLRPIYHWDMLFDPGSPCRQSDLLRELTALDPALESHPKLDRWLMGRGTQESPGSGPSYSGLNRDSARRRAYIEWTEDQFANLTGDATAIQLANGDHLNQFKEAALRSPPDNSALCASICRGVSQLESLPSLAFSNPLTVPLRVTSRTPTETYFWVEKPLERFRLEAEWPHIQNVPLPVLPRNLNLIYKTLDNREEILSMGYELFHTLLSLASGEQLSELRSDDLFANLAIFTQRIAKEGEGNLFAWNPKSDSTMHRLGVQRSQPRQMLTCESIITGAK